LQNVILSAPISQNPWYQFSHLYQQYSPFFNNKKENSFSLQLTYFQKKGDHTYSNKRTENIASLIFGAQAFQLAELGDQPNQNPLVSIPFLPELALKSNGILLEGLYQRNITPSVSFFLVAKTAFYNHKVSILHPDQIFNLEQTQLINLFQTKMVDGQTQFAFRLDALNRLPLTNTGPGAAFPFVSFFDQTFIQPGVSMRGLLVTDAPLANTPIVVEKTNPTTPPQPFVYKQQNPQQAPILSNTIDDTKEGDIRRFATNTDYRDFAVFADLASFWVIPTETGGVIATNAQKIQLAVADLVTNFEQSTERILAQDSLFLGGKNNTGFAGLWIQPGFSYHISEHAMQHWYAILILPAEKQVGENQLLRIAVGNNGHTAIGIGATSMFNFTVPLQLFFDYQYLYTGKKTEKIAIPRKNSTLRIGPVLDATRSWHTVYLDSAITTYLGNKNRLCCTLHYLLYHTSREHITLKNVDETQYNVRKKTVLSDQTIHTLSFDICFTYTAEHFLMSISASALKTVRAHQAVSEKGWSISCNINF
jgi:hypothetical protein